MRILVVEDEPSLFQVIKKRLKEEGYHVDGSTEEKKASIYQKSTNMIVLF